MAKIDIVINNIEIATNLNGEVKITLTAPRSQSHLIKPLTELCVKSNDCTKEQLFQATVGKYSIKRTLEANSYLWILCDKIAKAIRSTKEEVYKTAIKAVGEFDIMLATDNSIDRIITNWSAKGLGWFAEKQEGSKVKDCTRLVLYYGSSIYDRKQMFRLTEYIIEEAKALGIETRTPQQIAEMLKQIKE